MIWIYSRYAIRLSGLSGISSVYLMLGRLIVLWVIFNLIVIRVKVLRKIRLFPERMKLSGSDRQLKMEMREMSRLLSFTLLPTGTESRYTVNFFSCWRALVFVKYGNTCQFLTQCRCRYGISNDSNRNSFTKFLNTIDSSQQNSGIQLWSNYEYLYLSIEI